MISIKECKDGDIIATDIVNNLGVLIVVQNTEMNSYIREKLIRQGINNVKIIKDKHIFDIKKIADANCVEIIEDYRSNIITMKNILDDLACGKNLDLSKVNTITNLINRKINQAPNITQCIRSLQLTDQYTYTHSLNTAFYAMLIGKWLGFHKSDICKITQAGLLHDIGKTKIPQEILNKIGRLTSEEYDIIKKHTILGYNILKETGGLDQSVMRAVLLHHERVNRTGYPFQINDEQMGLFAKIIAIADVYDAMTSDRVYKKGITPFEAFEMFQTAGLSSFDISIVNLFVKKLSAYYIGMEVELDNGIIGEIVYVPPHDLINPIISVDNKIIELSKTRLKIKRMRIGS